MIQKTFRVLIRKFTEFLLSRLRMRRFEHELKRTLYQNLGYPNFTNKCTEALDQKNKQFYNMWEAMTSSRALIGLSSHVIGFLQFLTVPLNLIAGEFFRLLDVIARLFYLLVSLASFSRLTSLQLFKVSLPKFTDASKD